MPKKRKRKTPGFLEILKFVPAEALSLPGKAFKSISENKFSSELGPKGIKFDKMFKKRRKFKVLHRD